MDWEKVGSGGSSLGCYLILGNTYVELEVRK